MEAAQNLFAAIVQRKQPSLRCMKFTEMKKIENGNENKIKKNTQINIWPTLSVNYFESKEPKLNERKKHCKLKWNKSSHLHKSATVPAQMYSFKATLSAFFIIFAWGHTNFV